MVAVDHLGHELAGQRVAVEAGADQGPVLGPLQAGVEPRVDDDQRGAPRPHAVEQVGALRGALHGRLADGEQHHGPGVHARGRRRARARPRPVGAQPDHLGDLAEGQPGLRAAPRGPRPAPWPCGTARSASTGDTWVTNSRSSLDVVGRSIHAPPIATASARVRRDRSDQRDFSDLAADDVTSSTASTGPVEDGVATLDQRREHGHHHGRVPEPALPDAGVDGVGARPWRRTCSSWPSQVVASTCTTSAPTSSPMSTTTGPPAGGAPASWSWPMLVRGHGRGVSCVGCRSSVRPPA